MLMGERQGETGNWWERDWERQEVGGRETGRDRMLVGERQGETGSCLTDSGNTATLTYLLQILQRWRSFNVEECVCVSVCVCVCV